MVLVQPPRDDFGSYDFGRANAERSGSAGFFAVKERLRAFGDTILVTTAMLHRDRVRTN